MTESLERWVNENKLVISESTMDGSDIIKIEGVGDFLYIHSFDGDIIDEDFGLVLTDEEFTKKCKELPEQTETKSD